MNDERFFAQMLSYLDSGFPFFVPLQSAAMEDEGHAVVLAGYEWRVEPGDTREGSSHVWSQVNSLFPVDENSLRTAEWAFVDNFDCWLEMDLSPRCF